MAVIDTHSQPSIDWRIFVLVGVGVVAGVALWATSCAVCLQRCIRQASRACRSVRRG